MSSRPENVRPDTQDHTDHSRTNSVRAHWQILSLGEQLAAQPTIAAQRERIVETATRLLGGQAELWLGEAIHRLAARGELPSFSAEPPSDLMRRAIEVRRVSTPATAHEVPALTTADTVATPPPQPGSRVVTSDTSAAVALLAPDTTLGVLEVRRPGSLPFSQVEVVLLDGIATQSAIALQAARQVAIERWRLEQLALVRAVSAQVADVLDLDELARRVTDLILNTFEVYHVALFILEPGQEILHMHASAGPRDGFDPRSPRREQGAVDSPPQVQVGQGIIGHAARDGVEIVAQDVHDEPRYQYVDALPETQSEVALPLKIEARVLGVLDVQSDQPDDFDETSLLVLRALADQIAIAVEGARLYGDLRRRADQLSAVTEVSRAVSSILNLETLLEEIVGLIHRQFGYPYVYLFTVDPLRAQIVYRAGVGPRTQALQAEGLVCSLDESAGIVPWVTCHGETVLTNDVRRDPRYRPSNLPPIDTHAELAVPLIFGSEVLGALDVHSDRPGAFTDDDRFLFEALGASVAIAIRNANLYRSERWRRQVADGMREVAGLLSANAALDQVLEAILEELARTLPCDAAAIWLLRDGDLCLSAVRGDLAQTCISVPLSEAGSWLTQTLDADQPIIRSPQSPYEPLGTALSFPPDYSAIAAPLRAGDRRLGLLTLAHRTTGRYGAESRIMTDTFASYAAVAIENTRLYQEVQETARISTVMLQVAKATQSLTTLEAVIETVVQLVPRLVGTDRCAILLWDRSSATFMPSAAYGLDVEQQVAFDKWLIAPEDEPAFDDIRLRKAPIFIYDAAMDDRLSSPVVWLLGFESLLILPLLAQGEVQGAMLVDYQRDWFEAGTVETLHNERLAIIQGIALQAATAIENTGLREAQQEEAYVSTALLQVAQAVASLCNLDDILGTIARIVPILIGVERCIMFLWDDEPSVFRPVQAYGVPRGAAATLLSRRYAPGDFPLLDNVREQNHPVVHPLDASPEVPEDAGSRRDQAVRLLPPDFDADFLPAPAHAVPGTRRALLAVPLSVQSDVLGVMVVEEAETAHGCSLSARSRDRRLELVAGIAHQAALAVQNERLQQQMAERERLEHELQLAREIQQALIPGELPQPPGWDLAATWRAARQVAGDFYDVFELPERRLGLVIADVADKGMPAALFMTLTRTLMRAAALEETSPAAAIERANDLLVPDARHGMFVTAIYAVLSLETGELAYANAGHNLPLLLRSRTGELERLNKGGMALGVLAGTRPEEHTISLEPGDCLVLYTDGITEAFSPDGDMYGEDRLQAAIQSVADGSAQKILDAIDHSVIAFTGDGLLSDDQTLVVVRRK